jgi:hypothetical protein
MFVHCNGIRRIRHVSGDAFQTVPRTASRPFFQHMGWRQAPEWRHGPLPQGTVLQHPDAIRHFQSLCDACQELSNRFHGPSELRLYADGYLHALRRTAVLDPLSQRRLEELVERWIMDPSSFIGPDGDPRTLFERETGRL